MTNSNVQSNGKVQTPAPANLVQPIARPRNTELTEETLAELARLRAENAVLKAAKKSGPKSLSLKVSEKGALSIYGMGRFPVTLYREQWVKLLAFAGEIQAFIEANSAALKTKEQSAAAKVETAAKAA